MAATYFVTDCPSTGTTETIAAQCDPCPSSPSTILVRLRLPGLSSAKDQPLTIEHPPASVLALMAAVLQQAGFPGDVSALLKTGLVAPLVLFGEKLGGRLVELDSDTELVAFYVAAAAGMRGDTGGDAALVPVIEVRAAESLRASVEPGQSFQAASGGSSEHRCEEAQPRHSVMSRCSILGPETLDQAETAPIGEAAPPIVASRARAASASGLAFSPRSETPMAWRRSRECHTRGIEAPRIFDRLHDEAEERRRRRDQKEIISRLAASASAIARTRSAPSCGRSSSSSRGACRTPTQETSRFQQWLHEPADCRRLEQMAFTPSTNGMTGPSPNCSTLSIDASSLRPRQLRTALRSPRSPREVRREAYERANTAEMRPTVPVPLPVHERLLQYGEERRQIRAASERSRCIDSENPAQAAASVAAAVLLGGAAGGCGQRCRSSPSLPKSRREAASWQRHPIDAFAPAPRRRMRRASSLGSSGKCGGLEKHTVRRCSPFTALS